jgi:hypothetical protein
MHSHSHTCNSPLANVGFKIFAVSIASLSTRKRNHVMLNLGAGNLFFAMSNTKSDNLYIFESKVRLQILKQRDYAKHIWIIDSLKL